MDKGRKRQGNGLRPVSVAWKAGTLSPLQLLSLIVFVARARNSRWSNLYRPRPVRTYITLRIRFISGRRCLLFSSVVPCLWWFVCRQVFLEFGILAKEPFQSFAHDVRRGGVKEIRVAQQSEFQILRHTELQGFILGLDGRCFQDRHT